jgi:antitoxin PrlF
MKAPVSRISSGFRTIIPKALRQRLGLKPGDFVRYVVEGRRVVVERAKVEADDPLANFDEWASEADESAYDSL